MIETLVTERLVLRPFVPEDLEALALLGAEPTFWWYGLRRAMTPAESAGLLARIRAGYSDPEAPSLHAVEERDSGSLAGYAGLSVPGFLPEILPAVEVGWRLGRDFWGRGYATEAGAAALDWGFGPLGLTELVSIFEPANAASGRVMDRLGFDAGRSTHHPDRGWPLVVRRLAKDRWLGAAPD